MDRLEELRKKMMQQTREQVGKEYGEKELSIIRAANALEDLDAIFNLLFEHSREWYHAFFPELEPIVNEPETFLRLVFEIGSKENFTEKKLEGVLANPELSGKIIKAAKDSIGTPDEKNALNEIQLLALNALNVKQERNALETFLQGHMQQQAPNFSKLAGSLLGGKLLAKAGSFKRLAEMPASTLQLLGAEKALFRHLKTKRNARPPKYGFLFSHPLVKQLAAGHKGKMARFLSGKLAIAVRTDVFGNKQTVWEQLEKQLQKRFAQLQAMPAKPKKTRPDFFKPAEFSRTPSFGKKPFNQKPFFAKNNPKNFQSRPNFSKKGNPRASIEKFGKKKKY